MVTIAQLRAVLAILRVDPSGSEGVHRGPADEQADLVSLLHRVISGELQQLAAAATAPAPAPALLDAAAHSAHATAALLALSRRPEGAAAEDRWQGALYDLGTAYHLLNDEYIGRANSVTAPMITPRVLESACAADASATR